MKSLLFISVAFVFGALASVNIVAQEVPSCERNQSLLATTNRCEDVHAGHNYAPLIRED